MNEYDNFGALPLDLALQSGQYSIAQSLLEHRANVDALDSAAWPLLLRYIVTQRLTAARFLIEAGACVDSLNPDGDSALHLAADMVPEEKNDGQQKDNIVSIVELLLAKRLNVNLQNRVGDSALHRAIRARNMSIFTCLLRQQPVIKLQLENDSHETPLWLALQMIDNEEEEEKPEGNENCFYFAQLLLDCPAVSLDWAHPVTGDSLLNGLVRAGKERAALFLVEHGANVNVVNRCGESVLHLGKFVQSYY